MSIKTVNPFNNEVVETFKEMSPQTVNTLIRQADKTYQIWKTTSFSERLELLYRIAHVKFPPHKRSIKNWRRIF